MIPFREAALRELHSRSTRADVVRLPPAWMQASVMTLAIAAAAAGAAALSITVPVYAEGPAIVVSGIESHSHEIVLLAAIALDRRSLLAAGQPVHLHVARHPGARIHGRLTRVRIIDESDARTHLSHRAGAARLPGPVTALTVTPARAGSGVETSERLHDPDLHATVSVQVAVRPVIAIVRSYFTTGTSR